jgi:hypothetical protein
MNRPPLSCPLLTSYSLPDSPFPNQPPLVSENQVLPHPHLWISSPWRQSTWLGSSEMHRVQSTQNKPARMGSLWDSLVSPKERASWTGWRDALLTMRESYRLTVSVDMFYILDFALKPFLYSGVDNTTWYATPFRYSNCLALDTPKGKSIRVP